MQEKVIKDPGLSEPRRQRSCFVITVEPFAKISLRSGVVYTFRTFDLEAARWLERQLSVGSCHGVTLTEEEEGQDE